MTMAPCESMPRFRAVTRVLPFASRSDLSGAIGTAGAVGGSLTGAGAVMIRDQYIDPAARSRRTYAANGFFRFQSIAADEDDRGVLPRQFQRGDPADSRACAGDDAGFTVHPTRRAGR